MPATLADVAESQQADAEVTLANARTASGMAAQRAADDDGTANNDLTALGVDETSADVLKLVRSAAFAAGSGSSTVHTFDHFVLDTDNETNGNQTQQAFEGADTYNAVQTFAGSSVAESGSVASVKGNARFSW